MFAVHLTCSDGEGTDEVDVIVEDLAELDGLVCDCGYGTVAIRVAMVELV